VRPTEEDVRSVLHAGKTYTFRISISNPMYDNINVQLFVQRHPSVTKPGFAVSLPSGGIQVGAYQEAWEYDEDEEETAELKLPGVDDAPIAGADRDGKGRIRSIGIVERKANVTVVAGEVLIGKECQGDVKFTMNVVYAYRTDEQDSMEHTPSKSHHAKSTAPDVKTYLFSTVVYLGTIVQREGTAPRKTIAAEDGQ